VCVAANPGGGAVLGLPPARATRPRPSTRPAIRFECHGNAMVEVMMVRPWLKPWGVLCRTETASTTAQFARSSALAMRCSSSCGHAPEGSRSRWPQRAPSHTARTILSWAFPAEVHSDRIASSVRLRFSVGGERPGPKRVLFLDPGTPHTSPPLNLLLRKPHY
jgi:hypothetical protein